MRGPSEQVVRRMQPSRLEWQAIYVVTSPEFFYGVRV